MTLVDRVKGFQIALRFYPRASYLRYYQKYLERTGSPPSPEKTRIEALKLRDAMIKSGPLFIKMGQLLSSRRDVIPEEYIQALTDLQDQVPLPDFAPVKKLLEKEIGKLEDAFESFEPAGISGASLGLVYKARYKGKDVAVKVNRPGIEETIKRDKPRIEAFVKLLERYLLKSFSLSTFTQEFLSSLELELDYKREAESIELIGRKIHDLDLGIDIVIPKVYREISTSKVLVMEYLEYIKISDVDELKRNGADTRKLAEVIDKLFLRLALRAGRFHADPHPGNIGWRKDNRLVLMDFGMTSELSEDIRDKLLMGYYYLATFNARNLLRVLVDLDLIDPGADKLFMEQLLTTVFKDLEGKEVTSLEYSELMHRANVILFRFPFRLPYNLALFARMSVILEGVCKTLDPNFKFISVVAEIMDEERASLKVIKTRILNFPKRIERVIEDFMSIPELVRNVNRALYQRRQKNYSTAIISAALFVTGSLLAAKLYIAIPFFVVGSILAFFALRS
ncbi:MAG: AarF/UbiB family protein [Thermoplasmatales archaeon]